MQILIILLLVLLQFKKDLNLQIKMEPIIWLDLLMVQGLVVLVLVAFIVVAVVVLVLLVVQYYM